MKVSHHFLRALRNRGISAEVKASLVRCPRTIAGAAITIPLCLPIFLAIEDGFADPIVTIHEKGSPPESRPSSPNKPTPFDPRRTSWIAELERTRNRIKRKTGIDLDIELAKSLCRSGSLDRCEEAVARLQEQVTALSASSSAPLTPPTPPSPPQSNTSVIILTQPHHRYRPNPTYPPPIWETPRSHQPRTPHEFALPGENMAPTNQQIPSGAELLPDD
jgi:hypothetical protein